jgi:hypothetical protein
LLAWLRRHNCHRPILASDKCPPSADFV